MTFLRAEGRRRQLRPHEPERGDAPQQHPDEIRPRQDLHLRRKHPGAQLKNFTLSLTIRN